MRSWACSPCSSALFFENAENNMKINNKHDYPWARLGRRVVVICVDFHAMAGFGLLSVSHFSLHDSPGCM